MDVYRGAERRSGSERRRLTTEEINEIAIVAANIAMDHVYAELGKGVVKKFLWVVGIVVVSLAVWLVKSGKWMA